MPYRYAVLAIVGLFWAATPAELSARPQGRVTGVGGIFIKSDDPKALMAW